MFLMKWQPTVTHSWHYKITQSVRKKKTADCSFWEHLDWTWCLLLYFINYWFVHTTLFISSKHFEGWTSRIWKYGLPGKDFLYISTLIWAVSCSKMQYVETFWVWRSFSRTLTFCMHCISTHSCHIEVWLRCCTVWYKLWLPIRNNFTYNHRSFQSRSGNMTMWWGDWVGLINNFWSQLQVLVPM